ncbi:hypothetical protein P7C73_g1072, partial [Tremellales sp. Uapishka_1]
MILTNALWPVFAISSLFGRSPVQDVAFDPKISSKKGIYPGHTLYKLNDGNIIPSPAWGTGTGTVRGTDAIKDVLRALENGWRHIDTSLNYGNQVGTGIAIKKSGIPRKELYITSKYDAVDGKDVAEEIQTTLKQLNLTYLDSYLIHSPGVPSKAGGLEKIWPQMEQLVKDGLVKTIGVSNYQVKDLEELYSLAKILPAVNQIDYSVYNAISVSPTLSLGFKHGLLFSAYGEMRPITKTPGGPADDVGKVIAKRLSHDYGSEVTYSQVILDWLKSTGVLAVTTTSNEGRLKEQLVPFGSKFPLLTAAEVRAFELSAYGYGG